MDDLRGIAAALVLGCHLILLWPWSPGRLSTLEYVYTIYLGGFGVAIFFVISGLVIYRPFVIARETGGTPDTLTYAVRRLTRIVPPYWVALAFFAVVLPTEVRPVATTGGSPFWIFAQIYSSATYAQGLTVAWTLCVEISFYVAVPLLAFALLRRGKLEPYVLMALWITSLVVRIASPHGVIGGTLVGYFGWFAVGMWLARLSLSVGKPRVRSGWVVWTLAAAGFLLLARHLPLHHPTQNVLTAYVGLGVLGGLVVLPAITHPGRARMKWLGDRSYGVYLWHYPVIAWLAQKHLSFATYLAAGVVMSLAAAHFSYRYLEQPLMRRTSLWARRRRERARAATTQAPVPALTTLAG